MEISHKEMNKSATWNQLSILEFESKYKNFRFEHQKIRIFKINFFEFL